MVEDNFDSFDPKSFADEEKKKFQLAEWKKFKLERDYKASIKDRTEGVWVRSKSQKGAIVQAQGTRISKLRPQERLSIESGKQEKALLRRIGVLEKRSKRRVVKKTNGAKKIRRLATKIGKGLSGTNINIESELKKQLRIMKLRKQMLPVAPTPSPDNIAERKLMKRQLRVDKLEKHYQDTNISDTYFLRKDQIKMREVALKREFARKKNLLAKQHHLPKANMNFLSVDNENAILRSSNILMRRPDSISLLTRRPNILQTKESNNNLKF